MPSVKGTILLPLIKTLRARKEESLALLPPELHHYLRERILPTGWYSEEDHLVLLRIGGRLLGLTSFVPFGIGLAQFELGGVYKAALYEGDAMRTMRSFVKFWPMNHDTGSIDVAPRRGGATIRLTDYVLVAREICEIITGYVGEAVRMSIGADAQVVHVRCRGNGAPMCVWEVDLPFEK